MRVTLAELNLQAMQPNPMYEGCGSSPYEAMDGCGGYQNPHIFTEPQYCALESPPPLPAKNAGLDADGSSGHPATGTLSSLTGRSVDKFSTGSMVEDSYTVMHSAGTIAVQSGSGGTQPVTVINTDRYVITHTTEC